MGAIIERVALIGDERLRAPELKSAMKNKLATECTQKKSENYIGKWSLGEELEN